MSQALHGRAGDRLRPERREAAMLSAADGLGLAAAPVFAVMALLSVLGGPTAMICARAASPLGGMAAMYLLMSAVHLGPWLRLIGQKSSPGAKRD